MMTDSTTTHALADLLEAEFMEAFDWDPSALADWPNIPTDITAVPQAGDA